MVVSSPPTVTWQSTAASPLPPLSPRAIVLTKPRFANGKDANRWASLNYTNHDAMSPPPQLTCYCFRVHTFCRDSPTAHASAALAAARTILASFHPALSEAAVSKLRLHALHHAVQCACLCQQGVSATSSLHPTFPALLTRHIELLTQCVAVALSVTPAFSSPALLPALIPYLTPLLASLHMVLAYLPSTHSIAPAPRAALYAVHLSALALTSDRTAAVNAAMLYLKHLPSAHRAEIRNALQGVTGVTEKEGMEAANARLIITAAHQSADEFDRYRLLTRACDAVTSTAAKAEIIIDSAEWMHRNPHTARDAADLLHHALDLLTADSPTPAAHADAVDTRRSTRSDGSRTTNRPGSTLHRPPSTASLAPGRHLTRSQRSSVVPSAFHGRKRSTASSSTIDETKAGLLIPVEEKPLGVRELVLLVRGYVALSEASEREDDAVEWALLAAHHVDRLWATNTHTVAHYLEQRTREHERIVEERAKKYANHAAVSSAPVTPLPDLPAPALPTPPVVPTTAVEWFCVGFSGEVLRLMGSAELSGCCISEHSVPHPLLLFQALTLLSATLVRHSHHTLALPSVALQLHLTTLIAPCPPLTVLTHLRLAQLADALGLDEGWKTHMDRGDAMWRPRKVDVDEWELRARQADRDDRIRRRAAQMSPPDEEAKEEMRPSSRLPPLTSLPATSASMLSPSVSWCCPRLSLPYVYLETAALMQSWGRHTAARVLRSLACALAVPLGDAPTIRLHALLEPTPSPASLSSVIASAESASEFRRAFGALMTTMEGADATRRRGRLVDEVRTWAAAAKGVVMGQRCVAVAQALQAQLLLDECAETALLPPLPVSPAVLRSLQLVVSSATPLPIDAVSVRSSSARQRAFTRVFELLSSSTSVFQATGDGPALIRTLCLHAHTASLYAATWSSRGRRRGDDEDGEGDIEGVALSWRHLMSALRLWLEAERLLTAQLRLCSSGPQAPSIPLQRRLAHVQQRISGVYAELFLTSEPETVYLPASAASASGSREKEEAALLREWMERYDDVFSEAPPPPPPSLPQLASARASSALALHRDGLGEFVAGRADLLLMVEQEEQTRRVTAAAAKHERRTRERAAWKEVVYAPYEAPEERAARILVAQQRACELEEIRLMQGQETARALELAQLAELERQRRAEEEAARTSRTKGKKPLLASPGAKLSKEEAERVERERAAAEERRREVDRVERERAEREAAAAEDAAFAYDDSEWSPAFMLRWKRDVERERMDARVEAMDEAQGKAATAAKGKDDAAGKKKKRQQSLASIALSDDDDGLDPTILVDEPFAAGSMALSAYTHLISALQAGLASHDFDLLGRTALALVRLFTTRHPLLSSKYLALHQSAVVSQYALQLTSAISPATAETLLRRERDRLATAHFGCRWDAVDDDVDRAGGGLCRGRAVARLSEWLSDESLIAQWTTAAVEAVEEKDSVLRGWDAVYAGMLVSIPSSVSIVTLVYSVEERALYLSLLSSERFPLSSRFSRTALTEEEDDELHRLIAFFQSLSSTLQAALSSGPQSSPATAAALTSLDAAFTSSLASLNGLLARPFARGLLDASLLNDRDLIILPCPRLFALPWEAVAALSSHGHRSLCRDFSFAFFNRRMETSVGDPINRAAVAWVVEGGDAGEAAEAGIAALKGREERGRKAEGGRLGTAAWPSVMETARDSGALMYVGQAPLLHSVTPAALNVLDGRGVRLAVLMDHAVPHPPSPASAPSSSLSLYDALLLLSVRGVNSILAHSWSLSSAHNAAHTQLAATALANGQSIASVLRLLREQTEVEVGGPVVPSATPLSSPTAKRGKGGPLSPKRASPMSPKAKALRSPQGGASLPAEAMRARETLPVRSFDRYNPVLIGLPHWRL